MVVKDDASPINGRNVVTGCQAPTVVTVLCTGLKAVTGRQVSTAVGALEITGEKVVTVSTGTVVAVDSTIGL